MWEPSRRVFAFAWVVVGCAHVAHGQGLTPEQAAARMTVPAGFEVSVVASEPLVRQPVCIEWDDRGRLWVIQYLQYPNPEGLKRVSVDRFSRTKYDRVPEPPPKGPRGADRITILEDVDGDGRMDRGKDFVDGLNLATGLAFGHGGVFVVQVPYLLFYPDKNRDDVPDGDPEVLLTGFGMEDAHSVANSLMFGPDGWLYGCQGSTVTANIRGIEFQQGVWRYHPVTKAFELFCEGGGNSWGLDFDRTGRLLYSTNWGEFRLLHGVQGAYYVKSFGKHGALHNPHAYGYFEHAPHKAPRGGHVTIGGIVYQGTAFPPEFRGKYIAGDLLGHAVYWHDISPRGSTVATTHEGEMLLANDPWFGSTDVTMGPDDAVYVSDWHDERTAHPDPDADWDRTNGRVYRVAPKGSKKAEPVDFAKLSDDELLARHGHASQWHVRRARNELTRRFGDQLDSPAALRVRERLLSGLRAAKDEVEALERFWSLVRLGAFDEKFAETTLHSPHPGVRAWTVRLLGDAGQLSPEMAHRLDEFAEQEPVVDVRQQIACSAGRFPAAQAMPMINANINRDIDNDDPYLPLLWWWAVEKHSVSGREEVLKRFVRPSLWKSRLGRDFLLTRLVRRYAAEGTPEGMASVGGLLKAAPDEKARLAMWPSVLAGWQERPRDADKRYAEQASWRELSTLLSADRSKSSGDSTLLKLAVEWSHDDAIAQALKEASDASSPVARRVERLAIAASSGSPSAMTTALRLLNDETTEELRAAAVAALARFDHDQATAALLAAHNPKASDALRSKIRDAIVGRARSAKAWLAAVERGDIDPKEAPVEQIRRVSLLNDPSLDSLVAKHWGRLQAATPEEKLAEVRRLNNDVRAAAGDLGRGKALFTKHCANCHQLFGEGAKIGPDLTSANRQDRDFLLTSMVDPSAMVRKEFVSVTVHLKDGRIVTGMPTARDDQGVTLANNKGEKQLIPAGDIDELADSPTSLMPEDLYKVFKPQELRDLFTYLQATSPPKP